jgi:uncharacterized protein (UPF0333 family)
MLLQLNKKGQSTLEYALLIGVIVAGLIAMQVYLKRGYQGRLRESTDQIGEQYSPGYTTSKSKTTAESTTREAVQDKVTRSDLLSEKRASTSEEGVESFENEYWK